jgi:hypothetical protein
MGSPVVWCILGTPPPDAAEFARDACQRHSFLRRRAILFERPGHPGDPIHINSEANSPFLAGSLASSRSPLQQVGCHRAALGSVVLPTPYP